MSWRDRMTAGAEDINLNPIRNIRNNSNIQKKEHMNNNIADIANIAPKNQNLKSSPEPANLGPAYDRLWAKALTLADYVDGDTAPYTDRVVRMPELLAMRDRLAKMEQAGAHPPGSTIESVKQHEPKETNPDTCPARCKQIGNCYGKVFFTGRSGKAQECSKPCLYASQFETFFKNKQDSKK